jgi:hypothetical protein
VASKEELLLYPNPVSGVLTISSGEFQPGADWKITVVDARGKDIMESIEYSGSRNEIKLDLSQLPNGFYLVRLKSEDRLLTGKIIKL